MNYAHGTRMRGREGGEHNPGHKKRKETTKSSRAYLYGCRGAREMEGEEWGEGSIGCVTGKHKRRRVRNGRRWGRGEVHVGESLIIFVAIVLVTRERGDG